MPWYEHCIALSDREGEIEMVSLRKQLYLMLSVLLLCFFPSKLDSVATRLFCAQPETDPNNFEIGGK